MKKFAIALLILAILPATGARAAETAADPAGFDFMSMAVVVGLNGILGLGVFAVGIIMVGLLVDKFKPWINVEKKSTHKDRKAQPHTHHFPANSLHDAISEERQDAY